MEAQKNQRQIIAGHIVFLFGHDSQQCIDLEVFPFNIVARRPISHVAKIPLQKYWLSN